MYKFLLVFIILLVILIIALNMGVLTPLKTEPEIAEPEIAEPEVKEGYTNATKKVAYIGYRSGGRIDQITFGFNTGETVSYGGMGGGQKTDIILGKNEHISQIEVYDVYPWSRWIFWRFHGQYRGRTYIFITNTGRDLVIDVDGITDAAKIRTNPTYVLKSKLPEKYDPNVSIIGIKWSASTDDNKQPVKTPTTDDAIHAWPYDIEIGAKPFVLDEKIYKTLFNEIEAKTGFKFNMVEAEKEKKLYNNVLAIVQHLDYVQQIVVSDIIDSGQINYQSPQYIKLVTFISELMRNGITDINELVELQANIRTTSSTKQGFTTIEGLTNDGRLTDAEAVCYINQDPNVGPAVAGDLVTSEEDITGLNFKIYNGYFQSNNVIPGSPFHIGNNPYLGYRGKSPGTVEKNGKEMELNNLLDALSSQDSKCPLDTVQTGKESRQNYGLCLIANGRTVSTGNVQEATTDADTGKVHIRLDNKSEYYTVILTGYFKPDITDDWEFQVGGDDAVYLFIDTDTQTEVRVSAVPDLHGMKESTGKVRLTADKYYKLTFYFGENWGGDNMYLRFRCVNSPKAKNWTSRGFGFYFLTPGTRTKTVFNTMNEYPINVISNAKKYWENNGKPNTYNCAPQWKPALNTADAINYGKANYADYRMTETSLIPSIERYKTEWENSGKPNAYIYPLPKAEPFVEGLEINESQINDYINEATSLNVLKQDIPSTLKDFKQTYGVDIKSPGKVTTFFAPLKEFGITDYNDLRSFKNILASENSGFIGVNQYGEFIQYMSTYGLKYNTSGFNNFMNGIKSFRIDTFVRLKNFHTQTSSIGFGATTNPLQTIGTLQEFGVENYNQLVGYDQVKGFVDIMKGYAGADANNVPQYMAALLSYGINYNSFSNFINDSADVSAKVLIRYIQTYSSFGIKYIGIDRTNRRYNNIHNEFIELGSWTSNIGTIPGTENAEKRINIIEIYKSYGFATIGDVENVLVKQAVLSNGGSRLYLEHFIKQFMIKDSIMTLFFDINDTTKNQFKTRLDKALRDTHDLFPEMCDFLTFISTLYTQKKVIYNTFKTYVEQNKQLFHAKMFHFIRCRNKYQSSTIGGSTSGSNASSSNSKPELPTNQQGFTTIREGFEGTGSAIFDSTVPFGLTDINARPAYDPEYKVYKGISDLNVLMSSFEIDTVEKYKLFLDKMREFGVTSENIIKYTNKLRDFRIKYSNYLSFTVYIQTIGVTYSGFDEFIGAILSLGVYAEDFVPFLCHLYSFGITYEPNADSQFFKFIRSMTQYGITYVPSGDPNYGGMKFTNAIKNFIFLLRYGVDSLDCTVSQVDTGMSTDAQETQLRANAKEVVKKGETVKINRDYARYFFDFTYVDTDPITVPLTKIIDICKSMDPEMRDIVYLNPYAAQNKIGFVPNITTSGANNTPDANKVIPYPNEFRKNYRAFMKFFTDTNVESQVKGGKSQSYEGEDKPISVFLLDVALVTTFMKDADGDNEYKDLKKGILSISKLQKASQRMQDYNSSNNVENRPVYATYNISINTMRLFPYFSIEYMKYFMMNSPNMRISRIHKNAAKNPENGRCPPYIKVGYDEQECSNTFTTMADSNQLILQNTNVHRPVQLNGKPHPTTTIQSSHFGTWDPRPSFSSANW